MPIRKKYQVKSSRAMIELTLDFLGSCCSVFSLCRSESWPTAEMTPVNTELTEHSDTWYI